MVRRSKRAEISYSESMTDDDRSVKGVGGLFASWFNAPERTETRDDSEYTAPSGETDSIENNYPTTASRSRSIRDQTFSDSFAESTDAEFDSADDDSLIDFDRDLRVRHGQACKYMRSGKFAKALKKFEGILAAILERFGETHHRVGAALHNVGIANLRAGKLTDAMDAIEEAVRIRKITLGPDDPKVADSLVELGIVLLSMKDFSESQEIFMEALDMREAEADDMVLPEEIKESNLKIAKVLNNIGCVNFENGNFNAAKDAFHDAIVMQKKTLGEGSVFSFTDPAAKPGFLTMASTMCNKGYIDLEKEDYAAAIGTFKESLKIQKLLLGADNKLVLSTLDNLGFAFTMHQSYDKALTVYRELLANQEKSYAETQVECGKTMKKIVYLELKVKDFEGALKTLCTLEDILLEAEPKDTVALETTKRLLGQVNYQVMKYPGCSVFNCNGDEADEEIALDYWVPEKPINGSKMSGHRVTCA